MENNEIKRETKQYKVIRKYTLHLQLDGRNEIEAIFLPGEFWTVDEKQFIDLKEKTFSKKLAKQLIIYGVIKK